MSFSPYEPQRGTGSDPTAHSAAAGGAGREYTPSAEPGTTDPPARSGAEPAGCDTASTGGSEYRESGYAGSGYGPAGAEPTRPFAAPEGQRPAPPPRSSPYDVGQVAPATSAWDTGPQPGGDYATDYLADQYPGAAGYPGGGTDPDSVRARERDAVGGLKIGAAFFGWLAAVGATVILVTLVAAVAVGTDLREVVEGRPTGQDRVVGIAVLIGVLFVAYYVGGYVAGRMARFNGARQGLGVWLWSLLIAAVLTLLATFTDDNAVTRELDLPMAQLDFGDLNRDSLIALGVVLGVSLLGAVLGGLVGMRFHRRVDRAGFAAGPEG